jgi:exopolysaccharide biosynthesis polyprenyl glycosylphosphotransferase
MADSRAAAVSRRERPLHEERGELGAGEALRWYRRIAIGLAVSDVLCVSAALALAYHLRFGMRPMPLTEGLLVVVTPLLWVAVFHGFGLYAPQHLSVREETQRSLAAVTMGTALLALLSYWSKSSLSRAWIGLAWFLALGLELLARQAWRWYQGHLKLAGQLAFRTLVIGTTGEAVRLAEDLRSPGSGFQILGHVRPHIPPVLADAVPALGQLDELRELIRERGVDCLFVAATVVGVEDIAQVARVARREGAEMRVSANIAQTLASRLSLQQFGPVIALSLRPVRLTGRRAALKRAFDLTVASVALLAILPLWVVIALAIVLTSRRPVLFHQERVTRDRRVFRVHKFRTMRTGSDQAPDGGAVDETKPFLKIEHDPRVTRVGRCIRSLSLDELPQLWNVIRGEMSLVGPRPLPVEQVAANPDLLGPRHEMAAGMTGWWQINGRSQVLPEEAVRLDQFYIENWSLALDLYVLLKTVWVVFRRKGAY